MRSVFNYPYLTERMNPFPTATDSLSQALHFCSAVKVFYCRANKVS